MSQRLLDIDVLTGLAGQNRDGAVPVIGGGDLNGIDIFSLKQPPEILVRLRARTSPFFCALGIRKVNVGRRGIFDAGHFAHQTCYISTAAAATDQAYGDAVV